MAKIMNQQVFNDGLNSSLQNATVNGSTAGTIEWNMPFQGDTYKKVIIYANGLTGTASITFPVAFTNTPAVAINSDGISGYIVTSLTTTGCTLTGQAADSGNIWIEGF